MNLSFFGIKGCYYLINNKQGSAYYALNPSLGGEGIFITNASSSGKDNTAANLCFNDIRVTAITGKAFGETRVEGKALLGAVTNLASTESTIQEYFRQNRAAKRGQSITLSSLGGGAHRFLLTGYNVGSLDNEFNILPFSFSGTSLE